MPRKWLLFLPLSIVMFLSCVSPVDAGSRIRILLVTGDDVAPSHNWKEMADATVEVLNDSGKFTVQVSETLTALESDTLAKDFDLIFITRYNRQGTLSDKGKANLENFVRAGKGLALSHLASASFKEWTEYRKMAGRYWVMGSSGHGPRSVFKNTIVAKDDPIVKGMADFETDDELYAKLEGEVKIKILVTADSDWSKKTEPLVFTLNYGKGRVFHEAYGHDGKAIRHPSVAKIIVRGCEWAATGKVSKDK